MATGCITTSVLALLTLTLDFSNGELRWERLSDLGTVKGGPSGREGTGLGYDDGSDQLVLFGGQTTISGENRNVLDDTWIFDLKTGSWRRVLAAESPAARHSFVTGSSQGYFYVATGQGPTGNYYQDIWRFSFKTETWEMLPYEAKPDYYTSSQWLARKDIIMRPSPRYGAAGGIFPNATNFFVSHGFSDVYQGNTVSYNLQEQAWFQEFSSSSPYNPSYPHPRHHHAGTMVSQYQMVIMGGCLSGGGTGGPCPAGDAWLFDAQLKSWTRLESCATYRWKATMAMVPMATGKRRLVLYGGSEDTRQSIYTMRSPVEQVAVLDPDTKQWVLRDTVGTIPPRRSGAAMVTGKQGVYMFGGQDSEDSMRLLNDLYLLRGNAASADLAPVSGDCSPTFFSLPILHGILMALAWGFFLPWGAFVARYLRKKDPLWFYLHLLFQIFGVILALAGFICACLSVRSDHFKFAHAIIGITVMVIMVLQPINAMCRPRENGGSTHKPARRVVWEFLHSALGHSAIWLALANISIGVFLVISHRIIWILWYAYLGLLVLVFAAMEWGSTYRNRSAARAQYRQPSSRKYVLHSDTGQRHSGLGDNKLGFENPAMAAPREEE